jgi:hypothetical protein
MNLEQTQLVLEIVKARLNRLASDTTLDPYLISRIEAAASELEGTGIHLVDNDTEDQVLLADFVVWQYSNRDKPGGMPDWLRLKRRERWLRDQAKNEGDQVDS